MPRAAVLLFSLALACGAAPPTGPDAGAGKGPLGAHHTDTACVRIGALDRIVFTRIDWDADECLRVGFVSPAEEQFEGLAIDPPWAIETATRFDGAGSCTAFREELLDPAVRVRGRISLRPEGHAPTELALDVTMELQSGAQRTLEAPSVRVGGECR